MSCQLTVTALTAVKVTRVSSNRPTRQTARHYTPRRVNRTSATRKSGPFGDWTGYFWLCRCRWRKGGGLLSRLGKDCPPSGATRAASPRLYTRSLSLSLLANIRRCLPRRPFLHTQLRHYRGRLRGGNVKRGVNTHGGPQLFFLFLLLASSTNAHTHTHVFSLSLSSLHFKG